MSGLTDEGHGGGGTDRCLDFLQRRKDGREN
jgi:hypothetical protein